MRHPSYLISFVLAAWLWTGAGESSDPPLRLAELPAEVLRDCPSCGGAELQTHWLGRAPQGEVFLVGSTACRPDHCRAWVVIKNGGEPSHTLLAVTGRVWLEPGLGGLPVVHTRTVLTAGHVSYSRFEWHGEQYVRVEARLAHRVDGVECDDDTACEVAAQEALRSDRIDRAVRIWQQVHGVNWI